MSSFLSSDVCHAGSLMPVVVDVPTYKQAADNNEQAVSYTHTMTQGMSHENSQQSSTEVSYAMDTCYPVEPVAMDAITMVYPGCQEKAVEGKWRRQPPLNDQTTVEQRNKLMSDLADFLCEV